MYFFHYRCKYDGNKFTSFERNFWFLKVNLLVLQQRKELAFLLPTATCNGYIVYWLQSYYYEIFITKLNLSPVIMGGTSCSCVS